MQNARLIMGRHPTVCNIIIMKSMPFLLLQWYFVFIMAKI